MNIAEILGRKNRNNFIDMPSDDMVLPECKVGIEVELENIDKWGHKSCSPNEYWDMVRDGSLRNNGLEFISLPIYGADVQAALDDLDECLSLENPETHDRTSLHIHLDVEDMTSTQLGILMVLEVIFERLLYTYCGIHRYDNIFCNPLRKSNKSLQQVGALLRLDVDNVDGFMDVLNTSMKYTGLNIKPVLPSYNGELEREDKGGHLEFRMHPGTTSTVRIKEWINILLCLKKFAIEFKHEPEELLVFLSVMGLDNIVEAVFGEYADKVRYPEQAKDIYSGITAVQYAIKNFEPFGGNQEFKKLLIPNKGINKYVKRYNEKRGNPSPTAKEDMIEGTFINVALEEIKEQELANFFVGGGIWQQAPVPNEPNDDIDDNEGGG